LQFDWGIWQYLCENEREDVALGEQESELSWVSHNAVATHLRKEGGVAERKNRDKPRWQKKAHHTREETVGKLPQAEGTFRITGEGGGREGFQGYGSYQQKKKKKKKKHTPQTKKPKKTKTRQGEAKLVTRHGLR